MRCEKGKAGRDFDSELRRLAIWIALVGLALHPSISPAGPEGMFRSDAIEVVYQFSLGPSGLTAAPDGLWLLSVNQIEKPRTRVVKVAKSGQVEPFPTERMSDAVAGEPLPLDAVEGMQLDPEGLVWMLDNGRRSELVPKVVAWNYEKRRLHWMCHIGQPAIVPGSYLADLAVDPNYPFVYMSDPANGADAALIVLDRTTGLAKRALQGHVAVAPDESVQLPGGRSGIESRRLDGSTALPHCGVDPIALDRKGEWLYFAPIRSRAVYRVKTEALRAFEGYSDKLAQAVERYADKPPAAAITIDNKGNLYVGDVESRAIGVIDQDKRQFRILASDPRLVWPDGLCFGADGKLYFFSRSSLGTNRPAPASSPNSQPAAAEHNLFRMKPLAPGRVGD